MENTIKFYVTKIKHSIISFFVSVVVIFMTIFFVYYDAYGTNMFVIPKDMNKKIEKYDALSIDATKNLTVFFGDSLTEFCDTQEWYSSIPNYNRGISSDTTSGMLARLEGNVLALEPSTLVILGGTNDINMGISNTTIVNNLRQIALTTQEAFPECRIIFQSLYPVNPQKRPYFLNAVKNRNNEDIIQINTMLEEVCIEYGWQYVDLYSILADENGNLHNDLTMDGLHVNDAGYKIISHILTPYILGE